MNLTPQHLNYDLLRIYTYYRIILSCFLLLMLTGSIGKQIVGTTAPQLYLVTALFYTAINFTSLAMLFRSRFSPSNQQIFAIVVIDIIALTLLMHASGGVRSGLGALIIISVAAGAIFINGQVATLLAAIASLSIIAESIIYTYTLNGERGSSIFPAGLLGALTFCTSLIIQNLAKRIRASDYLNQQQAADVAHLQELNQFIVQRMRTGIMVVTKEYHVRVMNAAAAQLLGISQDELSHYEQQKIPLMPLLAEHMMIWQSYPQNRSPVLRAHNTAPEIRVSFSSMKNAEDSDTLIFIEETAQMAQQAQQMKLASLGRLTASIAHEIRNPLGAISHAAQLLDESEQLVSADRRLTDIIYNHSKRMNQIIENILQLSRRKSPQPEKIQLQDWLTKFIHDYQQAGQKECHIAIKNPEDGVLVSFDTSQLGQILTNLIDNGLRYSHKKTNQYSLSLVIHYDAQTELPHLDVIDDGDGIPDDGLQNLFELFYTTEKTGTGLGLYISKELCEANQARLDYTHSEYGKSCFRISFSHPDRALLVAHQS